MFLSICRVILLKKPSTRLSHDACFGVNTNSNLSGTVAIYSCTSADITFGKDVEHAAFRDRCQPLIAHLPGIFADVSGQRLVRPCFSSISEIFRFLAGNTYDPCSGFTGDFFLRASAFGNTQNIIQCFICGTVAVFLRPKENCSLVYAKLFCNGII